MRHWHCQPAGQPSPIDIQHFNAETFCLYALKLKFWSCLLRFGHLAKAIKYLICYGNCICYGAIFPQIVFSNSRESEPAPCLHIGVCIRTRALHEWMHFSDNNTLQYKTVLIFTILITHFTIMHIIQSKLYPSFWFRKTFPLTFHFFVSLTLCKILWLYTLKYYALGTVITLIWMSKVHKTGHNTYNMHSYSL